MTLQRIKQFQHWEMVALNLAIFFNPGGVDIVFAFIMSLTHSYWVADLVLYCIATFFFLLYLYLRKKKQFQTLASIILNICLFFNPAGFDVVFASIMNLTHSYWYTDLVLYCIAISFFTLFLFLHKKRRLRLKRNVS